MNQEDIPTEPAGSTGSPSTKLLLTTLPLAVILGLVLGYGLALGGCPTIHLGHAEGEGEGAE